MRPHHGLVVGGADDDAVIVGEGRTQRIVVVYGPSPHGWPQQVAFQAEDQFENMVVELVVEAPEFLVGPARQCRGFVVDEYAPVFYPGFPEVVAAFSGEEPFAGFYGHVGPPVPG